MIGGELQRVDDGTDHVADILETQGHVYIAFLIDSAVRGELTYPSLLFDITGDIYQK